MELARAVVATNRRADARLRQFASIRLEDAEVGVHHAFKRYGLTALVEIENLDVPGVKNFPFVRFSSWIKYLLKSNRFSRQLCGCGDFGTMHAVLLEFWERFRVLFPTHDVFKRADDGVIQLSHAVPYFSHSDEGRSQKKDPLWVLSCHGAIGRGTRLYLKKRKHLKPIPQNEQGLNFIGQTFSTQFLICTILRKEANQHEGCIEEIVAKFTEDCAALASDGVRHNGSTYWMIPLGTKGDLPALIKLGGFTRTFYNVPRRSSTKTPCGGICHLCLGGQEKNDRTGATDIPYEDLNENPIWESTMNNVDPWDEIPNILQGIPTRPGALAEFFCLDIWHNFHLGAAKHWVASALVVIAESGLMPQSSMEEKFAAMTQAYQSFCRSQRIPMWIKDVSRDSLTFLQSSAEPKGKWNKGSCSTTMMLFLDDYCQKNVKGKTEIPVLLMIVP